MKRIWWPFCLLTLSRRIMCLEELSSAGSGQPQRGKKRGRAAPTVRIFGAFHALVAFRNPSLRAGRHRRDALGGIRSFDPRIRGLVITYQVEFKGNGLATAPKKNRPRRGGRGQRWLTKTTPAAYAARAVPTMRSHGSRTNPAAANSHRQQPVGSQITQRRRANRSCFRLENRDTAETLEALKKKEAPASMLGPLFTDEFLADYFAGACLCESAGT